MEIIIVGAGIAGLGAGVALRRAGHKVTILEQSSLLQEVGAAMTIKPNAWRVLRSWDLVPEQSRMVAVRTGDMFDGTNMQLLKSHVSLWKDFESTWGLPMYLAHRVDLHTQLQHLATDKEGLGRPCNILVRSKVVHYDTENAQVALENGHILQADLIVAADGVHSKAVNYVLDQPIRAKDTGWAVMRWLVPTEDLLSDPVTAHMVENNSARLWVVRTGKTNIMWYPCRNNKLQNFAYYSRDFDTSHVGEDYRGPVDSRLPFEYAKKHFAPPLQAVIKKSRDVKFWRLLSRSPIPRWHKNRLLLIGDAAHPTLPFLGQGAGQGIEDAAALGVLFDQFYDKAGIEDRLQLFEQVRRNKGSALQILSSTQPPLPQSLCDDAARFLPIGKRLNSSTEIDAYVMGLDVVEESKAALAARQSVHRSSWEVPRLLKIWNLFMGPFKLSLGLLKRYGKKLQVLFRIGF